MFVIQISGVTRRLRALNHLDLAALKTTIIAQLPAGTSTEDVTLLEIPVGVRVTVAVNDNAGTYSDAVQTAVVQPAFVEAIKASLGGGSVTAIIVAEPYVANSNVLPAPTPPPPSPTPPSSPSSSEIPAGNSTTDGIVDNSDAQKSGEGGGVSGGAIAGIVIGILILVCIIALIILYYMRRKSKQTMSATVMLKGLKSSTRRLTSKLSSTKLLAVEEEVEPSQKPKPVDEAHLHRI